jgi:hypothetical protein
MAIELRFYVKIKKDNENNGWLTATYFKYNNPFKSYRKASEYADILESRTPYRVKIVPKIVVSKPLKSFENFSKDFIM